MGKYIQKITGLFLLLFCFASCSSFSIGDKMFVRKIDKEYNFSSMKDSSLSQFKLKYGSDFVYKELDTSIKRLYVNHLTIKDMKQNVNLLSYISSLGNSHNGDVDHYLSNYGIHWNIDGHMEVAILLYKFINERYN